MDRRQPGPGGEQRVARGCPVSLHLEIRLADGELVLSTFEEEPVVCRIGDGTLAAGLEAHLEGLSPGSEMRLSVNGSDLFGAPREESLHWMERSDFPPDLDPTPGKVVYFESPGGHDVNGIVLAVEEQRILVDFNHPLSGRALSVRVKVLTVGSGDR